MAWGSAKKIRKYRPGAKMLGIFDLISAFNQGRYVFVNGKPYHPAVLRNWSLASLEAICRGNRTFVAELTPEWIEAEETKAEIARELEQSVRDRVTVLDIEFAEIGE